MDRHIERPGTTAYRSPIQRALPPAIADRRWLRMGFALVAAAGAAPLLAWGVGAAVGPLLVAAHGVALAAALVLGALDRWVTETSEPRPSRLRHVLRDVAADAFWLAPYLTLTMALTRWLTPGRAAPFRVRVSDLFADSPVLSVAPHLATVSDRVAATGSPWLASPVLGYAALLALTFTTTSLSRRLERYGLSDLRRSGDRGFLAALGGVTLALLTATVVGGWPGASLLADAPFDVVFRALLPLVAVPILLHWALHLGRALGELSVVDGAVWIRSRDGHDEERIVVVERTRTGRVLRFERDRPVLASPDMLSALVDLEQEGFVSASPPRRGSQDTSAR